MRRAYPTNYENKKGRRSSIYGLTEKAFCGIIKKIKYKR